MPFFHIELNKFFVLSDKMPMGTFFLKTALLTGLAVLSPANPAFAESSSAFKLAQTGQAYNNAPPANMPPGAPPLTGVPNNPPPPEGDYYLPENAPPPEISDVPLAPAPEEAPSAALNGLFDLSQLPDMPPEDPFSSPGSSTHRYPQGEKTTEQRMVTEQFDYSLKTVIFYLPCKGGRKGTPCKRPLLTNQKDVMFRYDKNRNINISGIGDTKSQKKETVSEVKGK